MASTKSSDVIELAPIRIENLRVRVEGDTPLVTHAWSEKAKKMMRDAQQKRSRGKKEPKDPQAEYESAFYRLDDGTPGIPAAAFKAAIIAGARSFDGVTMTLLKQSLYVVGEGSEQLVRIDGEPEMWESPVRVGQGTADLRYRPRFFPWSVEFTVRYNTNVLDSSTVVTLLDAGGMAGVGEWRPSAPKSMTGSYGMFRVVREEQ